MRAESMSYWARIRRSEVLSPEPERDIQEMPIAEYAQHRAELGVRNRGMVLGNDETDNPVTQGRALAARMMESAAKQAAETDMAQYEAERQQAGVRSSTDIFGVQQSSPRRNRSPWRV